MTDLGRFVWRVRARTTSGELVTDDVLHDERDLAERQREVLVSLPEFAEVWIERASVGEWERDDA